MFNEVFSIAPHDSKIMFFVGTVCMCQIMIDGVMKTREFTFITIDFVGITMDMCDDHPTGFFEFGLVPFL